MASSIAAGDIFGQGCIIEYLKKTAAAIAKGDLCNFSSTGFLTTAASADLKGPFAVCTKAAAAADSVVQAVRNKGAMVYVVANGAINPGDYIQNSGATAGQVIAYTANTVTSDTTGIKTARDEAKIIVGHYLAHVDEGNGDSTSPSQATTPTAAADTDTVRIMIGGL